MLNKYCEDFTFKANENYQLYEFLKESNKFFNWRVVAIFYSALCLAKAYLYFNGVPINTINSHDNIKFWLATHPEAKRNKISPIYARLYSYSRDARYTNKNIKPTIMASILEDYEKIKELFKIELF